MVSMYFELKQKLRLWIRKCFLNLKLSSLCSFFWAIFFFFSPGCPLSLFHRLFPLLYYSFALLLLTSHPSSLVSWGAGFSWLEWHGLPWLIGWALSPCQTPHSSSSPPHPESAKANRGLLVAAVHWNNQICGCVSKHCGCWTSLYLRGSLTCFPICHLCFF